MMEAYNLAAAWKLPVVFVCKDNRWSITTASADVTGGNLIARAASFGLATEEARGERVDEVYAAAGKLIRRARKGRGPGFLFVTCYRPGGHFEGDPIVRITENPIVQSAELVRQLRTGAKGKEGGSRRDTVRGLREIVSRSARAVRDWRGIERKDPLRRARRAVPEPTGLQIERSENDAIGRVAALAREQVGSRPVFAPDGEEK